MTARRQPDALETGANPRAGVAHSERQVVAYFEDAGPEVRVNELVPGPLTRVSEIQEGG